MRLKLIALLALALCAGHIVTAQSAVSIKGQLADTAEHRDLTNALVSLLSQKDSTLIKFARTSKQGDFQIANVDTGKYIVMVTHPYFADYFDNITLQPNTPLDLGSIQLFSKLKMLENVVVKSGSAIRIKGDTTVYTADSFKVREGANVEELLRKLPGIQVDRNGTIKAMGETVKNVLVDGEEFFGNDPGIATKNLRADIVKEVEVYDKKSDQATFTGIDDGVREKTINLKLKEDKKKGYFGKIEAGGGLGKNEDAGTQNKFNNAAMINAFKGKRKIAAYGIMSNTGTLNLNWDDRNKYGGSDANMEMGSDGSIMFYSGGDDYNSSDGIPTNWNGGVHYSNKFNQDKQSLNTGYKFTKINAPAYNRSFSRNFIKLDGRDSTWLVNNERNSYSSSFKHNINLTYEIKLDSSNTLKWIARGNQNHTYSDYTGHTEYTDTLGRFLNTNKSHGSSESDRSNLNTSLLWMHKFKKPSRTLSINASFDYNKLKADGFQYSDIDYFTNGDSTGQRLIDQHTLNNNESNNLNAKIAYTEPLMKDAYLELSYALGINNRTNNRIVNARGTLGAYNNPIDSLSNDFVYNTLSNSPGLNFRLTKKKYNFSFGTTTGFSNYEQLDRTLNTERKYHFVNYFPRASFNYKIRPSENIYFNYYGATNAPTLEQLQPVRDNSDPLNQRIGNPDLNPSFRHGFSLWYNSWKMLKERGIWASARYNFTRNAFVNLSRFKDSIRTYQTVNANGMYDVSANMNYNIKLKGPNIFIGFGPEVAFSQNIDFTAAGISGDATKIKTKTQAYNFDFSVSKNKDDKYDFRINPRIGYNISANSANKESDIRYWTSGGDISGRWTIVKNLDLSSDVDLYFQQKDPKYPGNYDYVKWNANLTKKFAKNKFEARAAVYDILNQNRSYNRNFSSSSFTESYRTVLKRFWMVSFVWNITKSGSSPAPASK
ncbi:TonB dependent receptor [Niabella pedocola]|uniref:TonB dependent receptor n=1 Tax=Niabella pedocola TaxID=1752077 RepID=A0ABS8PWH3_9BACT|nr:outer membrane beta-barrel protein [Niabella pedocola]MCD2425418.1 TonB dependent receptor [Niabella pedocola]